MRIVVDSGCDYTEEVCRANDINIERVPLTLTIDEMQFIDDGTIDIEDYLNKMEASINTPKSAAPSPTLFFDKYLKKGSVFVVTLSSHLSSSYNNAMVARQMYLDEIGNKFIHIFDSLSASVGEFIVSLKINELAKQKLSDNEIVENVTNFITDMRTYFILENYSNLAKNGRMNAYIAKLGKLLSIRPICAAEKGAIVLTGKAMGFNNAINKLITIIEKEKVDFENKILAISHSKCIEKALYFKSEISKKLQFKDIIIVEVSALCATYAERGGIIISF